MAVATAATLTVQDLVQQTELDPQQLLLFTAASAGTVSGGLNVVTCTVPAGLGCLWISLSAVIDDASAESLSFELANGTGTWVFHGSGTIDVGTFSTPPFFDPPRILQITETMTALIQSNNTDGDTMTARALAFAWDLQVARNIPQKFFWPGTLN